jgi:cell division septation protein DedD
MDTPFQSSGDVPLAPKSRRFSRKPILFASVEVGEDSNGLILNISEGGLCVQTAKEIVGDWLLQLRFQSLRSQSWVVAQGRVVWKNEAKTISGIQFVDLSEEAHKEVQRWLSFGNSLEELRGNWVTDRDSLEEPGEADPGSTNTAARDQEVPAWLLDFPEEANQASADEFVEPENSSHLFSQTFADSTTRPRALPIGTFAAVILIMSVVIFSAQHTNLARRVGMLFARKAAAADRNLHSPAPASSSIKITESASPSPLSQTGSAREISPPVPTPSPAVATGAKLVLQVAAMTEEENAKDLSESLRLKNFPAFVIKRPKDHFYRVAVGPYASGQSLRPIQEALEKEGLKPIEKRWNP